MKQKSFSGNILLAVLIAASFAVVSTAAVSIEAATARGKNRQLPEKLPTKAPIKRTYIDFSSGSKINASPKASALEKFLNKSERDLKAIKPVPVPSNDTTVVHSRKILPGPDGDASEPLSALSQRTSPVQPAPPIAAQLPPPRPLERPLERPLPPPVVQPVVPKREYVIIEEFQSPVKSAPRVVSPAPTLPTAGPEALESQIETKTETAAVATSLARATPVNRPVRIFTLRSGYLQAGYSKFDDRMRDGATSMGLGFAREIETDFGEIEARLLVDIYHAMDQSVSIENVRMFNARAEGAYRLATGILKPALSLGLGWADYSIRSYRSASGENGDTVTLRTHAKSHAVSIVPGLSVRTALTDEIILDGQAEFIALLGGNSSDAAQGLGLTLSLGWIF